MGNRRTFDKSGDLYRILSDKLHTKETNYSKKLFVVLLHRLIDRLIDLLIDWLIGSFIHSSIHFFIYFIHPFISSFIHSDTFIHYGWSPQTNYYIFYSQMASVCWWYFFSKIIELLDTVRNIIWAWLSCLNHPFSEFSGKRKYTSLMFNSVRLCIRWMLVQSSVVQTFIRMIKYIWL